MNFHNNNCRYIYCKTDKCIYIKAFLMRLVFILLKIYFIYFLWYYDTSCILAVMNIDNLVCKLLSFYEVAILQMV